MSGSSALFTTNLLVLGAVATLSLVAALFFLRFWRETRDRLYLFFAASFALEGLNRAALATRPDPSEGEPVFYLVRFFAFLLIIVAIVDKNTTSR